MSLTAEELLAGGSLTHEIEIPIEILYPNAEEKISEKKRYTVTIRPLRVKDIQIIIKAAKDNELLTSSLLLQQALVEPKLGIEQIFSMHCGLVKFLIEKINQVSGLSTSKDNLSEMVQAPLAKACFILAREFGWTPQEVSEMTIGQILLYIEMIRENPQSGSQPEK
ncbi:MAG: hypothetical protein J7J46_05155 [Candidatus Desulfofervidus sp.]|nr:hypothetical protein [Candidatus Desulfofervidus sp.]